MTRGTRVLLSLVAGGAVLLLATLGTAAAVVRSAGIVSLEFEDRGDRFRVSLPAGLLTAAVALTPDAALEEAASELAPLLPALDAGWQKLAESPDFVLLEVRSSDEWIRVTKSGSRLVIFVDEPDAQVRIAVPLGTVGSLLHRLERRS